MGASNSIACPGHASSPSSPSSKQQPSTDAARAALALGPAVAEQAILAHLQRQQTLAAHQPQTQTQPSLPSTVPPSLSRAITSLPPPVVAPSASRPASSFLSRQVTAPIGAHPNSRPVVRRAVSQFSGGSEAQEEDEDGDEDEDEELFNDNTNSKVAEVGKGFDTQSVLVERLRRQFDQLDKDKSGFLDYHEMDGLLRAVYEPSEEEVEEFLNKFDNNGDGQISFAEFRAAMKQLRSLGHRTTDKHLRKLFNFYDQDRNGVIEGEELKELAREALEIDPITKRTVMNMIDTDKDRRISFEEFANKIKSIHLVSTKKGRNKRVATLISDSRV